MGWLNPRSVAYQGEELGDPIAEKPDICVSSSNFTLLGLTH